MLIIEHSKHMDLSENNFFSLFKKNTVVVCLAFMKLMKTYNNDLIISATEIFSASAL